MPQVKIYGLREHIEKRKERLSDVIHSSIGEALGLSSDKRFHRYFALDHSDFIFGPNRTDNYTIIEIMLFEGRPVDVKRSLIKLLYERIEKIVDIQKNDLEIILIEIPKANWGIRGMTGIERDKELELSS